MQYHSRYRRTHEQSRRLRGHDYGSAGYYFVTINTYKRRHLFGTIEQGVIMLNECGRILLSEWRRLDQSRPDVTSDVCAIMPNHFHCLIHLQPQHEGIPDSQTGAFICRSGTLGAVISQLKSRVTKGIREMLGHEVVRVWQSNYHDRVIRDIGELRRIRRYILRNPACFLNKGLKKRKGC